MSEHTAENDVHDGQHPHPCGPCSFVRARRDDNAENDAPLTERALLALDHLLHRTLDGYISRTLPGWGHLQLWQWRVCNAYESRHDRRTTLPGSAEDAP